MDDQLARAIPAADRAPTPGGPTVSVVIASFREHDLLDACLRSILPQAETMGAEVVVAREGNDREIAALGSTYPSVRFVPAPRPSGVPELRAIGMAAAGGDIVALTEDHCIAAPDWLEQMLGAHRSGADVVGGSMDNAQRRRAIDWAAYFAEYGFFAGGGREETDEDRGITGANVTYSRRVLPDVIRMASDGAWENVAHAELAARGTAMRFVPRATVYQNKNYTFWDFCRDRFEHGEGYARRRLLDEGSTRRFLFLAGSLVLPVLLLSRVARMMDPRHRTDFVRALPYTTAFLTAWSLGEAIGYLRGAVPDRITGNAHV